VYLCPKCGWTDFHVAHECPRCLSELTATDLPGVGKIVTFTCIRYPPKGYEDRSPYVVAIVRLGNGVRVIGRLVDPVDDVKIGSDVALASNRNGTLEFKLSR